MSSKSVLNNIKMSFFGKEYTFDRQENFEEFVNALGLPTEQAQEIINSHPNQKLLKDGDNFTLVSNKELKFKSGVPFEEKVGERKCATTLTLDGNTLTHTQHFEEGVKFKYLRVFTDDQLVVTVTHNKFNGTATRYYKAV